MDGLKEIQKITLKNLTLRMHLRNLAELIVKSPEEYDSMTNEELDNLINYYRDIIEEFDKNISTPINN